MRTGKHIYFLDLAKRCAQQSTCLRRGFGAIIVDEIGTIVSTGYTGAPKGIPHCATCWRQENNIPSGKNYEKCRSVHAEQNALLQAGKRARGADMYLIGINMEDGCEVCIMPCLLCAKMLINAQINRVYMRHETAEGCGYIESHTPLEIYTVRAKEAFSV